MAATESAVVNAELKISIERMTEHDLLEVCEIEETTDLSIWGWEAYHKELQVAPETIMLVARAAPRSAERAIAGFIVARIIAEELHINNVAVRRELQGRGIGSKLLQMTMAQAVERGAKIAHLEVRATNNAAQGLYHRCGFHLIGRRRNYYRDPTEDALLMSVWLSG